MDMEERIIPTNLLQYSPSRIHRSMSSLFASSKRERYLAELLAERQKLGPFLQVLPFCSRLLNQEIVRASGLLPTQSFVDPERIEQVSPLRLTGHLAGGGPINLEGWSGMQTEENGYLQRMGSLPTPAAGWNGSPASLVHKKVIRMDIPVDKFPNFNFVGRLLGPRGNSLKRVEATTQCRVYIRGHGSVKDSLKGFQVSRRLHDGKISLSLGSQARVSAEAEEKLRDKPGYEHLNEPLHVLLEAEFPADIIDARLRQAVNILEDLLKPVDESRDFYKKNQLRELAILNGTL